VRSSPQNRWASGLSSARWRNRSPLRSANWRGSVRARGPRLGSCFGDVAQPWHRGEPDSARFREGHDRGFGVPHTEVDLVMVNGESSDFLRLVQDGDRVAVYPMFESIDITPELRLRSHALREPKFVAEVVRRFDLARALRPFTRCMACNEPLRAASKAEVRGRAPPRIVEWCGQFRKCVGCGRVYWQGSHYRRTLTGNRTMNRNGRRLGKAQCASCSESSRL
jgi:hypothetical protein